MPRVCTRGWQAGNGRRHDARCVQSPPGSTPHSSARGGWVAAEARTRGGKTLSKPSPLRTKPREPLGKKRRPHRKSCRFCADKVQVIDYKAVDMIRNFMTDRGKIIPRRISGACAKHQRSLTTAIKRARTLALLPFTTE
ncbi:30S ribosomal protein S18 [candidate division FCPU426 bacterium]|nr:30S ribosomal protein S18 [candidate division FCPU426 bacterium]